MAASGGAPDDMRAGLTYADAGVSVERGNAFVRAIGPLAGSTRRTGADGALGGFGGVFDIAACGYRDPLLVAANDGVGTKLKLAIEADRHKTVGIDLVAMCVNDLVVQGAEPLFFLDYLASARLEAGRDEAIVAGIAAGCREAGCALIGGETAELPGLYAKGDYDLAGFAVGAVERDRLLPKGVGEGDVLLALPSSGIHSNGFSLVRRVVEREALSLDAPAPFADAPLGEALLEPTRIYVRALLATLAKAPVRAMAHITGGGLTENVPRVLGAGQAARIDLERIGLPPVFGWLREAGGIEADEMLRTFNCGVGMVVIVPEEASADTLDALGEAGERAFEIGRVIPREGEPVEYVGTLG